MSFLLFVAICATTAYWILQLWRPPVRPTAAPAVVPVSEVPLDAAASLFGGRPVTAAAASNVQLKGIVLADNSSESVAILAIDGKPARAVRVNTEFEPGMMVREVHARHVLLSDGGIVKQVTLPEVSRAVQQPSFQQPGFDTGGLPTSTAGTPLPAYTPSRASGQLVNPLPGQGLNQLPGQAMPLQ